jgi:hypothetical protein
LLVVKVIVGAGETEIAGESRNGNTFLNGKRNVKKKT